MWIHSVKDPTSRLVRWRLKLAEYEYDVIYKPGRANTNADALSRNPPDTRMMMVTRDPAYSKKVPNQNINEPESLEIPDPSDNDTEPLMEDEKIFNSSNTPYAARTG